MNSRATRVRFPGTGRFLSLWANGAAEDKDPYSIARRRGPELIKDDETLLAHLFVMPESALADLPATLRARVSPVAFSAEVDDESLRVEHPGPSIPWCAVISCVLENLSRRAASGLTFNPRR
jgi:hypothetical protein